MTVDGIARRALMVGGTLLLAGCTAAAQTPTGTSTPSSGGGGASGSACSDGPRWPRATAFPYQADVPTGLPACTPHCGTNAPSARYPGALTSDALPSGACSGEATCVMSAEWLGSCPATTTATGPLEAFVCRCDAGSWRCAVDAANAGGSAWECSPAADAGP